MEPPGGGDVKFSWAERAAALVAAATLAVCTGWFLQNRSGGGGYTVTAARVSTSPLPSAGQSFSPDAPLDLNAAELDDLMGLPGIGETRAAAILDYRARRGPFQSPEELMEVPGIGPATFEQLRPYITVTAEGGG